MAEDERKTDREHWPHAVKREAIRLRREEGLTHRRIRERLLERFDADVPEGTLGNWIKGSSDLPVPPVEPGGYVHSLGKLAGRTLALIELEITRMERRTSKPLDLDRLERVCRALKSLESIKAPSSNGSRSQPRTLEDLADVDPSVGPI